MGLAASGPSTTPSRDRVRRARRWIPDPRRGGPWPRQQPPGLPDPRALRCPVCCSVRASEPTCLSTSARSILANGSCSRTTPPRRSRTVPARPLRASTRCGRSWPSTCWRAAATATRSRPDCASPRSPGSPAYPWRTTRTMTLVEVLDPEGIPLTAVLDNREFASNAYAGQPSRRTRWSSGRSST
jgi:hypothetical protein